MSIEIQELKEEIRSLRSLHASLAADLDMAAQMLECTAITAAIHSLKGEGALAGMTSTDKTKACDLADRLRAHAKRIGGGK
jgi:hypothetical protein